MLLSQLVRRAGLAAFLAALLFPSLIQAQVAYVISDNTSGHILESAGSQKKLQIGSLTKVATAMVVLDWAEAKGGDLNLLATVPASAQAYPSSNGVGFKPDDRCSLRDLLYAALIQSDNQAAEALAHHVGRSLEGGDRGPVTAFVVQMNALARRLGMLRTRFTNPHGLDGLERTLPYSTAEDLARLTKYAMERSAFRFYVSQKERRITTQNPAGESSAYLLRNTNELLGVDGIDGVKTGTTRKAGQCLIVSADRPPDTRQMGEKVEISPRRLNVVVLGSTDRFAVSQQLMQRGWGLYEAWVAAGRPAKAARAK